MPVAGEGAPMPAPVAKRMLWPAGEMLVMLYPVPVEPGPVTDNTFPVQS